MNRPHLLKLVLAVSVPSLIIFLLLLLFLLHRKRSDSYSVGNCEGDAGNEKGSSKGGFNEEESQLAEDLLRFQGGEGLTISEILDAPGEVIGKSIYGTLYKASMLGGSGSSVRLLRFLRPVCVGEVEEFGDAIRFLGGVRHRNLVPLLGFYGGRRGEKLLVHPFYRRGNLADFIRDNGEPLKPSVIYRISTGIARGLDHLHAGLQRSLIHGNLKSKNVFLDRNWEPCISDLGLHLLLNPASGQQMLEALSTEGYKAPELMKIKEVNEGSDIFGFGVILLELLTGREPIDEAASPDEESYLPNYVRKAVLEKRISELYRSNMVRREDRGEGASPITEEGILKLFQLALACCSPSPSLRPNARQVLRNLEEISK
ncbi:hypothetical protein MLD38_002827 [Melastoma candidum]|uniref:Uncharacterized protein n=1 Tax=Melastoma candidum TaxID=119954 RepID=A0ACB9S4E1_9MYRT|nr:hypothetical protein MLD38_002827 [Melastoma candidum]